MDSGKSSKSSSYSRANDDAPAKSPVVKQEPLEVLEQLCEWVFHLVARRLRRLSKNRRTLNVQDLLHSLLQIYFEDVLQEESSSSSRMGFLLKREQIVVVVKKARATLGAKEIGEQLLEDVVRYQAHHHCKSLVCFVHDPEGRIANPRGLEADLAKEEPMFVRVYVRPR
ncbi:MAG: hypothetical protein KIS61_00255 [Candidatus Eremiobacteraeota bacterium]|jgi:hypothetical protein|nr:hypothetical protein [Candidatus Eremiobacteraeota bacterium]